MVVAPKQANRSGLEDVHVVFPGELQPTNVAADVDRVGDDEDARRPVLETQIVARRQLDVADDCGVAVERSAQHALHPALGGGGARERNADAIVATAEGRLATSRREELARQIGRQLDGAGQLVVAVVAGAAERRRRVRVVAHDRAAGARARRPTRVATAVEIVPKGGAPVRHVRAPAVYTVDEDLDRAYVVARDQDARRLLEPVAHERQRHERRRGNVAAGLFFAVVRVEIEVAARLRHAVTEKEDALAVRVDHVDELGIGRVEANVRRHALEVRLGGVEARDAAETGHKRARVPGCMRAERVPDQMYLLRAQAAFARQPAQQVCNLKPDEPCVRRRLRVQRQRTARPVDDDHVIVAVPQQLVTQLADPPGQRRVDEAVHDQLRRPRRLELGLVVHAQHAPLGRVVARVQYEPSVDHLARQRKHVERPVDQVVPAPRYVQTAQIVVTPRVVFNCFTQFNKRHA